MKKFTLIFLSIFMFGTLLAQNAEGPSANYSSLGNNGISLYSQMNPDATFSVVASQQFTDYSNSIAQIADDFTIPAGKYWTVGTVSVLGNYYNGSGPADSFTIQIFEDNGGVPSATPLYEYTGLTASTAVSGRFDFSIPNTQLVAGHYWISVFAVMAYNNGGQWGIQWNADVPTIGSEFAIQDPDDVIADQDWPTAWGAASTNPSWANRDHYDMCFELSGSESVAPVPVSNWAIIIGILLIGTFMAVRYKRSLA